MNYNFCWKNLHWLTCCSILLGTIGCSNDGKKPVFEESNKKDTAAVQVFHLKKEKLSSSIQIPGELIAFQKVDLYAKVNSFVKKLYADVGSEVRTGQLLAALEAPELNSELSVAVSKLKSAEATYIASKSNYDRLNETKTPGTVSQNDIDQALAKKNSAEDDWEAAKSSYQVTIDTKKYLEIRAPFAGIISSRNVNLGAYVGPSGKGSEFPLFTIEEQTKLRLVLSVPEAYTANLSNKPFIHFSVKDFPANNLRRVSRGRRHMDVRLRSEN
jgi:RND family efflux transporter MFP subunit